MQPRRAHRTFRFYVTDSTDKFKRLATRFLGRQVDNVEHVDWADSAVVKRTEKNKRGYGGPSTAFACRLTALRMTRHKIAEH